MFAASAKGLINAQVGRTVHRQYHALKSKSVRTRVVRPIHKVHQNASCRLISGENLLAYFDASRL